MPIDHAEVRRIAQLAQLEADEAEVETLARDLESILAYVALLDELESGALPSGTTVHELAPRLRDDEPLPGLTPGEATANAPESAEGHFRVPRVLDE